MFLHKAIQEVLRQNNNVPMTIEEIASKINRQRLFIKKDGSQVRPWNVGARAIADVDKSSSPSLMCLSG